MTGGYLSGIIFVIRSGLRGRDTPREYGPHQTIYNRFIRRGPVQSAVIVAVEILRPTDVVIMDNLSSHKGPCVREMIDVAGVHLLYLPPYSPDFNPIEKAFSKLKALLRKAAERTLEGLWTKIRGLIQLVTPDECRNYFTAAGYDPE